MRILGVLLGTALGIATLCPVSGAQDIEPNDDCLMAQTIGEVEVARSIEGTLSGQGAGDVDFFRLAPASGLRVTVPASAGALIRERDGSCEPLAVHPEGTTFEVQSSTEFLELSLANAASVAGDADTARQSESYRIRLSLAPDDAVPAGNFAQATQAPGQRTLASVIMQNTGTTTWTAAEGYQLLNVAGLFTFGPVSLPAGVSIAPGQRVEFTFEVFAPAFPGTFPLLAQMGRGGQPFGATTPLVQIIVDDIHADNARILRQVVPDELLINEIAFGDITVRNEGTTTWTAAGGYGLFPVVFIPFGYAFLDVPADVTVAPGQTYTFEILFQAAPEKGFYPFRLQMARPEAFFGNEGPTDFILVDDPLLP